MDMAAPAGTPIYASKAGKVTVAKWNNSAGYYVSINHGDGFSSIYMHMTHYIVYVGQQVSKGQVIGYVGSTGRSTGPHLDFRLWKGSTPINPLKVPQKPAEPISKDNRERFERVKVRIMAELNGEVPDSMKVTNLEMLK